MTNIQAAYLQKQLENIDYIKQEKSRVFDKYKEYLRGISGIETQQIEEGTEPANWMFAIKYLNGPKKDLEMSLFDNAIQTRPMFPPVTYHRHYSHIKITTSNAEALYDTCFMLPSYPDLTNNQIKFICNKIKSFC